MADGNTRLVNFPEAFSYTLDGTDVAAMKDLLDSLDFNGTVELFRKVRSGQYNRSSTNKTEWLGIPRAVKVPSFYTSSTDWRNGTVDNKQRNGSVFKAKADGRTWDADLHAAETIGRLFFLEPKTEAGRLLAA